MEDFERNSTIRTEYNFDFLATSLNTFLFQLLKRVGFYVYYDTVLRSGDQIITYRPTQLPPTLLLR
jgi:hypothetical protein